MKSLKDRLKTVEVKLAPEGSPARIIALVKDYIDAGEGATVNIRAGVMRTGDTKFRPALSIEVAGKKHLLWIDEAEVLVKGASEVLKDGGYGSCDYGVTCLVEALKRAIGNLKTIDDPLVGTDATSSVVH